MGLTSAVRVPHHHPAMEIDPRLAAFVSRFDAVAARLGVKRATLSTRVFNDGKRIEAILSGNSDIGIGRLAKAERELSALEGTTTSRDAAA
jgi:hypothetical protein